MNRLFVSLAVASTVAFGGCGEDDPEAACTGYLDAATACAQEAYPDNASSFELPASTCDGYGDLTGSAADSAAEWFDCYTDTINAGDCSTPEGYSTTMGSISSCVTGG